MFTEGKQAGGDTNFHYSVKLHKFNLRVFCSCTELAIICGKSDTDIDIYIYINEPKIGIKSTHYQFQ